MKDVAVPEEGFLSFGDVAVPSKSPANCITPVVVVVASATPEGFPVTKRPVESNPKMEVIEPGSGFLILGASAVPCKSPANCTIPFSVSVASPIVAEIAFPSASKPNTETAVPVVVGGLIEFPIF